MTFPAVCRFSCTGESLSECAVVVFRNDRINSDGHIRNGASQQFFPHPLSANDRIGFGNSVNEQSARLDE